MDALVKRNRRIVLKRWQKGKNGREWMMNWMILEWRWIEWNGCDRVIDEVEIVNENVNMSDSKRESYWELNSDQPHFSILVSLIIKEIGCSPIELYNSPFIISNYFTFI